MSAPVSSASPEQARFLRRIDRLFALLSLSLLALFLVSTAGELRPEWRRHQAAFASALRERQPGATLPPAGIRQIFVGELGLVDRCPTCHAGALDRRPVSTREPLRPHPGQMLALHPPDRFGCTSCHEGQGRGTSRAAAHGQLATWKEPLLVGPATQSACAQCHSRAHAPHAPDLEAGYQAMRRLSCNGCHEVPGLPAQPTAPPDLRGLRSKTTPAWVYRWLKDPGSYLSRPGRRMPAFELSDVEIASIIRYLFEAQGGAPPGADQPAGNSARIGKELFSAARCLSCHAVQGKGGSLAPDLGRLGAKVRRSWVPAWLARPKAYSALTIMPRFRFSAAEREALADYLLEEFEDEDGEKWRARAGAALAAVQGRASVRAGRELLVRHNCAGCHRIAGLKANRIGPELTELGVKDVRRFDFGNKLWLPRTRQSWILEKLREPRGFSKLLRMPSFELSSDERQAIATALLSFKPPRYPASVSVPHPERPWEAELPKGEVGELFRELSCLECHSLDGRGGTIGPDLSFEGSQVRREWLMRYLKEPTVIRPSITERMVRLGLDDAEVKLLAEYLTSARQLDGVPRKLFGGRPPPPELVARGRRLFEERYPCGGCHITSHSRGYLGPELSRVGARLQPGWIYLQLQQPNRLRPLSIEPDLGVSKEDALALTAYLSSLGGSPGDAGDVP